jgi:hypothetical protein
MDGLPIELLKIARRNGILRAAKSGVRHHLFDRRARGPFFDQLRASNPDFAFDPKRLIVGDAASATVWDQIKFQPDVIYSTAVFEHIEPASLERLMTFLAQRGGPETLFYIEITVYTGLVGGHLTEWYAPHRVNATDKLSEPWEYLRRNRYRADTYLNKLTRPQYEDLFSTHFEILRNEPCCPGFGREFLTESVRRELADCDEYELLSNDVLFVLRARPS